MDQVLMNLAVNARDAMPEGGRLVIETANVVLDEESGETLLGAKPGAYALLSVSDTGQGMDKETLGHIFEPFYTTKEAGKGTGLGLAMVYGIVKQHGAYIACYSEPGQGTTFKIYFPAVEQAGDSETRTNDGPIRGGTETILLVEDEEDIRDLGAKLLNEIGYRVVTAVNGKEALEIYQRDRESISLVILDLIMPVMDGRRCLDEILRINPKARVVIASGYSESGPANGVMDSGAKGFVQKPYNMRQLLTTVREVLDNDLPEPVNS
jgi:CheY-like chemotaxis protein